MAMEGEGATMQVSNNAMKVSGGEVNSAEGNTSLLDSEVQTSGEVNQTTQSPNESNETTHDKQDAQKNSAEKSDGDNKTEDDSKTPEDIMEKYLMKIRALEDEWAQFTNSKEYRDLPEQTIDEAENYANQKPRRQIDAPNRKFLEAAILYRKVMLYCI